MENRIKRLWGKWVIVTAIGLAVFGCYWQEINWQSITFSEAVTDCDSTGCYLWAPGKSFTNPVLSRIWEHKFDSVTNSNWTIRDTFFFEDSLRMDPYLVVAGYLNVPDSLVCSLVTYQGNVLTLQQGKIYYDGSYTQGNFAMITDTTGHSLFQQSFLKRCE